MALLGKQMSRKCICVCFLRLIKAVTSFSVGMVVFSPVTRRQTSNVTANPGTAQSGHSSRRSAGAQSTSRRQQMAHAVRQPVNSIQPQVFSYTMQCCLLHHCECDTFASDRIY